MEKIESNLKSVGSTPEKVFAFLSDLNNHQQLMPPQASEWWSNGDEAKMKMQGLGDLHLKKDIVTQNSYIKIVPLGKVPFDLYLEWHIQQDETNSKVKVVIMADLNMFMKMMAMKPLQSLVDHMVKRVNEILN